jgi:hypothetical protein
MFSAPFLNGQPTGPITVHRPWLAFVGTLVSMSVAVIRTDQNAMPRGSSYRIRRMLCPSLTVTTACYTNCDHALRSLTVHKKMKSRSERTGTTSATLSNGIDATEFGIGRDLAFLFCKQKAPVPPQKRAGPRATARTGVVPDRQNGRGATVTRDVAVQWVNLGDGSAINSN